MLATTFLGIASVGVLLATHSDSISTQVGKNTSAFPELAYKSASPLGFGGGTALPASCESNYDHTNGAAYFGVNGTGTNVSNAGRVLAGRAIRLNNGGCVWTSADEFISRDATNSDSFWNVRSPNAGMPRWSSGSYNGH